MSLHYSSGRLLLKNSSNLNWYYISATLKPDGKIYLKITQDSAGNFAFKGFDEYAILRASNGDLYKFELITNLTVEVTYKVTPAESPLAQLPVKIFVRDLDTNILYSVKALLNPVDGVVYINLSDVTATNNSSQSKICACPVVATMDTARLFFAASILEECTLVIPLSDGSIPIPDTGEDILGEGGETILDENGNPILGEQETLSNGNILDEGGNILLDENGNPILGQ